MERRRLVRVPASSANLGPGFDSFAVALSLELEVEVTETGKFSVESDLALPLDRSNFVVRGFERLRPADDFSFRISSSIPLSGGLGTSAASFVAGLMAADHIFELDAPLLELATELDNAPDNSAASIMGGFVIAVDGEAVRFEPPDGLEGVLVVPGERVETAQARAALAPDVSREDAVFNVAHASILTLGLATGDLDLVSRGLEDRLHQQARSHLYPRSMEVVAAARETGALGATVSGAGPTVLVWTSYEATGSVVERLSAQAEGWATVQRVGFEPAGADVSEL